MFSVLYSNDSIPSYPSDSNIDPYDVTINRNQDYDEGADTKAIKVIMESGTQELVSTQAGEQIWVYSNEDYAYRGIVRGIAEKMPSFGFSGVGNPAGV